MRVTRIVKRSSLKKRLANSRVLANAFRNLDNIKQSERRIGGITENERIVHATTNMTYEP